MRYPSAYIHAACKGACLTAGSQEVLEMYLDPAEDKATARRTVMVAALGKDTKSVEEVLPSGRAWKNPMPIVWPSNVEVSSKVKRGNAGGQKGVI